MVDMLVDKKVLKRTLEMNARKFARKGENSSNLDLYNLCVLNRIRDKIRDEEEQEDIK